MRVETKNCSKHGHPEFILEVKDDQIPEIYINAFIETLESMVADGSVFKPGENLQNGWMLTRVEEAKDGKLTLHEPDMKSMPVKFVPGVTETLRHKMFQLFTLDSFGIDRSQIQIPLIGQTAIVCNNFDQDGELLLAREEDEDNHSGWTFICLDESHDHEKEGNLSLISLYEAMVRRPFIVAWMYFPVGSQIVLKPDELPMVFLKDKQLNIQPGSYLDELWKQSKK